MGIISWIILGALAGWLASIITGKNAKMGATANIVVGIVGALIGGYIGGKLLGISVTGLNFTSILIAVAGAVILLLIIGFFSGKK